MMNEKDINDLGGVVGISKQVQKWAMQYAERKAFCYEYFGGRADTVIEQSKVFSTNTTAGPIQSLDICMQVEVEFPGRLEEFLENAKLHPDGMIPGLGQYLRHVRNNG